MGYNDHRTTSQYKAEHKRQIFQIMSDISIIYGIHDKVINGAKILSVI